jgi:hypothetical protein
MTAEQKHQMDEDPPKLIEHAERFVRRAKGDREAAARALLLFIRKDPTLREEAVEIAARYLTRNAEFQIRSGIGKNDAWTYQPPPDVPDAVTARMRQELFDCYMLPNGTALGNAKRDDLKEAMDFHRKQEQGNRASRRFYEMLLKGLRGSKTVRQSYSLEQVKTLHEKYKHAGQETHS